MSLERKWPRRALLAMFIAGSTQLMGGGSMYEPQRIIEKPPYSEASVNKLVFELLDEFLQYDDAIEKVFRGGRIPFLKPDMYQIPASVSDMSGNTISNTTLCFSEETDTTGFSRIQSQISFGKEWYDMTTSKAQLMVLQSASRTFLQMPIFTRFQYKHLIEQGITVPPTDPDEERKYATKIGMELLSQDEDLHKLFTYGPYLLAMDEYDSVTSEFNIDFKRDMDLFLPDKFRAEVKNLGISYKGLEVHSPEYAETAFGENAWTDFVKNTL